MELLTKTETLVLQLSCEGGTMEDIAKTMDRSPQTVRKHRANIFGKLGADNIAEAIAKGFRLQLIR